MATRLHLAHRRALDRIRLNTQARVLAAPRTDLDTFLDLVVPSVLSGQSAAVAETDAYLSLQAGLATNSTTEPLGLDPDRLIGAAARRGVTLEEVYGRNFNAQLPNLAQRLTREVATDITLAQRGASFVHTNADNRVLRYRRVLRSPGPNCALCVVASTRIYKRGDLLPIHDHCRCTVEPTYVALQPGQVAFNRDGLDDLYAQAGSTSGRALSRIQLDPNDLPPGVDPAALPAEVRVITSRLGPTLVAA